MAPEAVETNGVTADGRQEKRITNYTKFWQNDMSKEGEVDTSNRLDSYADVVNGVCQIFIFNAYNDLHAFRLL